MQPPSVSIASVFGHRWAKRVQTMALAEARYEATEHLCELVNDSIDGCLAWVATQAIKGNAGLVSEMRQLLRPCTSASINAICAAAAKRRALTGVTSDDRPCMWCGDASDHATMVLCNRCNVCYHPQCAADSNGMNVHRELWFCHAFKGFLALWECHA